MMNARWRHLDIPVLKRITDQPAFLLHRRAWQNTSLILDLLTFDYGRVHVIARGSRSGKSIGLFQPFCSLSISWTGLQDLKTLTAVDGGQITVEEELYLPLLYVNEMLVTFLPQHESNPEVFNLYAMLLKDINPENLEQSLRIFERSAMQLLGYLPDMNLDANSGEPVVVDQFYSFHATRGFIHCNRDNPKAIEGRSIIDWNQSRFNNPMVLRIAKSIMRCIIDFNLRGKQLKSRDIYLQIKNRN